MSNIEQEFKDNMEELGKRHERSKVYVDFMDYYISKNSKEPFKGNYNKKDMETLDNAYNSFKQLMTKLIQENEWYDYIGEYYEEYILAGHKASSKGQYYTPRQISDLLSKLVGYSVKCGEAYDPACGSARNLLDYHSKHPDTRLLGEDLDESACKMAVINFHLHGVNGVVNWIDALTREYFGVSWRILEDRIYVTDMDWIQATDELVTGVSILMLSDDTVKQLMGMVAKAYNDTLQSHDKQSTTDTTCNRVDDVHQTSNKKESNGLDTWLKK